MQNLEHVLLPVEENMFVFFKFVHLWPAPILLLVDRVGGFLLERSELFGGEAFGEEEMVKVSWNFQVV